MPKPKLPSSLTTPPTRRAVPKLRSPPPSAQTLPSPPGIAKPPAAAAAPRCSQQSRSGPGRGEPAAGSGPPAAPVRALSARGSSASRRGWRQQAEPGGPTLPLPSAEPQSPRTKENAHPNQTTRIYTRTHTHTQKNPQKKKKTTERRGGEKVIAGSGGSSPSGARPRPPRLALTVGGSTQAAEGEQQAERPAARERPPPRPTPAAGRRAPVSALPARPHRRAEGTERGREERRGGRACRRRGQRGDEESRELETCTGGRVSPRRSYTSRPAALRGRGDSRRLAGPRLARQRRPPPLPPPRHLRPPRRARTPARIGAVSGGAVRAAG